MTAVAIVDAFDTLTDTDLARALQAAYAVEDVDVIIYAENEICGRLDLPLDHTEQGLTPWAQGRIDGYIATHCPA